MVELSRSLPLGIVERILQDRAHRRGFAGGWRHALDTLDGLRRRDRQAVLRVWPFVRRRRKLAGAVVGAQANLTKAVRVDPVWLAHVDRLPFARSRPGLPRIERAGRPPPVRRHAANI